MTNQTHGPTSIAVPEREIGRGEIAVQARELGVEEGGILLVHTSFRAVRPVEGGPAGLIGALRDVLGPAGTLVMPAWTGSGDEPLDPSSTPAAPDLGVVADTFWRLTGSALLPRPQDSGTSAGPRASMAFPTSSRKMDPRWFPPPLRKDPRCCESRFQSRVVEPSVSAWVPTRTTLGPDPESDRSSPRSKKK